MKCLVLHQDVPAAAPPDEQDVLTEAGSVVAALHRLGWAAEACAITLDLASLDRKLRRDPPDLVFNLVESLGGFGLLAGAVPALLEGLQVPFTGNGAVALALTADKPATRRALRLAGVPVPPGPEDGWPGPFIIKRATEHASIGLGAHSVVSELTSLPADCYAEAFIEGRECNVSMLADADGGCAILATAELVYADDWPSGMPRILDYAGKWDPAHPLYALTSTRFLDPAELAPLARAVWRALGLAGYARIDLRLGRDGVAYVIDVNANPCVSEEAGFAAAAAQAGVGYTALIGRIAELPMTPSPGIPSRPANPPSSRRVEGFAFRRELVATDQAAIGALSRDVGFFSPAEVAIAEELAADRLARGEASDYRFLLLEDAAGALLGYACYGAIPGAGSGWDLYWIVVDRAAQGRGIGRRLLEAVAADAAAAGATSLYAETEASLLYAPTRGFYAGTGFQLQAVLPDFYAPGRGKQIWMRPVQARL
jgi:D-alanine-D-alanine ligase